MWDSKFNHSISLVDVVFYKDVCKCIRVGGEVIHRQTFALESPDHLIYNMVLQAGECVTEIFVQDAKIKILSSLTYFS